MKLENLTPAKGSVKNRKRIARGEGSGRGGTATRGMNGAASRSGYHHKIGFEGGQMPLQRRLPKFGFKNPTRVEYQPVNVSALQALSEALGKACLQDRPCEGPWKRRAHRCPYHHRRCFLQDRRLQD